MRVQSFWTRWTILGVALVAACVILITFGLVSVLSKKDHKTTTTIEASTQTSTTTKKKPDPPKPPATKASKQVSLMFYVGPAINSQSRSKRSIDRFMDVVQPNRFDDSAPVNTKDTIYKVLDKWKDELDSGKTELKLSAYTDKLVQELPPSGSIDTLKTSIQDLYTQNSGFDGTPSQAE